MPPVPPHQHARRFDTAKHKRDHDPDVRTPTQKDRDRILYSSAFRRLSGITQVASPTELQPVHNRLIHSLKVAQVGRSLAVTLLRDPANAESIDRLGGIDPDVVEAAALAHDLGHPPFGHVAEETLDELLVDGSNGDGVPDGYNGNAQSFRIVTKLAVRYSAKRGGDVAGLNLTRATLNGILKYPWLRGEGGLAQRKWGAYGSEGPDFAWTRDGAVPVLDGKTIEAALMDWADDITYAVHDVEDFFRSGILPLDRIASDPREQERFLRWAVDDGAIPRTEADATLRALLGSFAANPGVLGPFRGSRADRAVLRNMTSELISRYVNASLELKTVADGVVLAIRPDIEREVRALKLLTRRYVIESPSLVTERFGQRALIRALFATFCHAAGTRRDWRIFPDYFQEALEDAGHDDRAVKRIVADLVSSMSEAQAIAIHRRLAGHALGSAMDAYLQ